VALGLRLLRLLAVQFIFVAEVRRDPESVVIRWLLLDILIKNDLKAFAYLFAFVA
jgi:hypothetical protein